MIMIACKSKDLTLNTPMKSTVTSEWLMSITEIKKWALSILADYPFYEFIYCQKNILKWYLLILAMC